MRTNRRGFLGSAVLLLSVAGTGGGLAAWKHAALQDADAAAAAQPEPVEAIQVALAAEREHQQSTTSIGTVLALRSITLRNELPGTVRQVAITPGQIVEAGAVLVALDVTVEEAELKAQEAHAVLAETLLGRMQRAIQNRGASELEVDRARMERDVANANIARTRAIIERKTVRAPFRARVGLADVHPGQYLNEGTQLTTLQGVDDAVHVDFAVTQTVAAGLGVGDQVLVFKSGNDAPLAAAIVAIDARVDPRTRNAVARAKIDGAAAAPAPGASVRVQVPVGPARTVTTVPANALRKGPGGDHVFVIAQDQDGKPRAHARRVESLAALGDAVAVRSGVLAGEQVATAGSFKLREGALVAIVADGEPAAVHEPR
jgi:membrane fusion protein (multidrug efflux system)